MSNHRLIAVDFNKLSCCCDSRSYCVRRTVCWQTIRLVYERLVRTIRLNG